MATFYIKTKDNIVYELTATTDVAFQQRNSITRFPVESGATVSDHSTTENTTLSLAGVITEVVRLNANSPDKGIKDYIEGLDALRRKGEVFTVFLDNRLKPFKNCLFTSLDYNKGVTEGQGSWRVALSIEQIRIVDKARASTLQVDETSTKANADGTNAKEGSKDAAAKKKDEGSKPSQEVSLFEFVRAKTAGEDTSAVKTGVGEVIKAAGLE